MFLKVLKNSKILTLIRIRVKITGIKSVF